MKIYVKSAGFSQDQDYSWQKIEENSQKRVDEPVLVQKFKHLIETEAPSILIGRESNQLILLVTGMKASKRKDYRGRTIRNSIALIAQDNQENEQKLRGIAVLALEEKLENEIDNAIKEGEECGFKVDYEKINNFSKKLPKIDNFTVTKHSMIGKNSPKNRGIIATELKESCLPQTTNNSSKILVIVTGIKTEDALKEAGVWRGLSNLVEKDLHRYTPPNLGQKFFPTHGDGENKEPNPKLIIALIISFGLIGLIVLLLIWSPIKIFTARNPSSPTPLVLAAITPGGQYFATADPDGTVLVQNTQNQTTNTIENKAPVQSVAISSDGKYVVTGDETGNVQLWDVTSKKKIDLITNNKNQNLTHEKAVVSVAIQADKNKIKIVSGGEDGKVLLWNIALKEGKTEISINKLWP